MSQKERENFYRQTTRIVDHSRDAVVSLIELYVRRNHITFEVFINTNQHAIFHLCFNKKPCCQCIRRQIPFSNPNRVVNESQLNLMIDTTGSRFPSHIVNSKIKFCCCKAKPNLSMEVLDFTIARVLLINLCKELFWYDCLTLPKITLQDFLNTNIHVLFHERHVAVPCCSCSPSVTIQRSRSAITNQEWNLLFDTVSVKCLNQFVVSNMHCLCRFNASQSLSQHNIHPDLENTILKLCCPTMKAVEVLRQIRNTVYGHATKAFLNDSEYIQYKEETETAILEIAKLCNKENEFLKKLDDLENRPLDETIVKQKISILLENINRESNIQKGLEDIKTTLQETIDNSFGKVSDTIKSSVENTIGEYFQKINPTKLSEEHQIQKSNLQRYVVAQVEAHGSENTFVETEIINIGLSCLNGKGVTVLVGPPGKTRNSLELLRKYTEQHTDFGMIQLHEPSLFGKLIRSDDRLVVLFDDVFGKTNCCFNEDVHMKDLDIVYSYVKKGFIKVILTMRNTIKKMCVHTISKHRLFEKCNLLDLALQSHQMNQRQKMECIRKYCAKFNVKETDLTTVKGDKSMDKATLSTTQICEIARVDNNPLLGFPESCYLFTSNFMFIKQGSNFFRHPTRNLCDEINNLRVSGQKDMINRQKYVTLVYVLLNGGYFDPYDIDLLMIDLILTSIYRFSSEICNCAVLVDSAKTMTGIYLKIDSSGKYSFQHRIIFESVLLSYADVKIESIIPLMKFDFILEMLRPQEFEPNEGEVVLLLPEKCYPLLANRLISVLKKDFLLIPDRFVQMLCGSRIIVLTGTKLISSICYEYERSDCDRFIRNERLTSGHFNLRSLNRHFYLPAGLLNTITICNGNESAVKYLLEYIKSRRNLDRLSRNAIVCYLFTAIANACQFHRENVLLVLGKIEFSRFKLYNISLNEYFLAREFDMNSWKMLLHNFGSLRVCEWFDIQLAIKSALESGFLYMDKSFIDYISFTYGKKTVDLNYFLNFACQNGKEIVVRWIFEQFETNHIDIISPLLSVCRKGNKELVEYLLRKCCIEDLSLNTTMQAACESGTLDVVKMLWEKFNFDIFDVESCFKSSCRKGNLNIVKWLYESFDKALFHDSSVLNLACISSNIELVEYLIITFVKASENEMTKIEECLSYQYVKIFYWKVRL
ncbi:uncharacterized protein LOC134700430 [Mytilus trossulus]|uniref:uncharacterized protein LOC134700430 n=1 Tax=Mytilus trossulus TaxID=6551 RepID=UPI003005BA6F